MAGKFYQSKYFNIYDIDVFNCSNFCMWGFEFDLRRNISPVLQSSLHFFDTEAANQCFRCNVFFPTLVFKISKQCILLFSFNIQSVYVEFVWKRFIDFFHRIFNFSLILLLPVFLNIYLIFKYQTLFLFL